MPKLTHDGSINMTSSRSHWLDHLEAQEKSGLKSSEYAHQQKIMPTQLSRWRWKLKALGLWSDADPTVDNTLETAQPMQSSCNQPVANIIESLVDTSQPESTQTDAVSAQPVPTTHQSMVDPVSHSPALLESVNAGLVQPAQLSTVSESSIVTPATAKQVVANQSPLSRPVPLKKPAQAVKPVAFQSVQITPMRQSSTPIKTATEPLAWDCRCYLTTGHVIEWARPPSRQEWLLLLAGESNHETR